MSGKKKQNTMKPTVISDGDGRLLWTGAIRLGRTHDVTALRTEGIEDLLRRHTDVKARVDSGYQGLSRDFPGHRKAFGTNRLELACPQPADRPHRKRRM